MFKRTGSTLRRSGKSPFLPFFHLLIFSFFNSSPSLSPHSFPPPSPLSPRLSVLSLPSFFPSSFLPLYPIPSPPPSPVLSLSLLEIRTKFITFLATFVSLRFAFVFLFSLDSQTIQISGHFPETESSIDSLLISASVLRDERPLDPDAVVSLSSPSSSP